MPRVRGEAHRQCPSPERDLLKLHTKRCTLYSCGIDQVIASQDTSEGHHKPTKQTIRHRGHSQQDLSKERG